MDDRPLDICGLYGSVYAYDYDYRGFRDLAGAVTHDLAAQLRSDAEVLGLDSRTEIVKAALELLHRRAAEERMARSVDAFYGDSQPPLPIGVRSTRTNRHADAGA